MEVIYSSLDNRYYTLEELTPEIIDRNKGLFQTIKS